MAGIDFIHQNGVDYEIVPEIAELFSTTKTYHTGDHVIYEAGWYTFEADKSVGAWDATKVNGPFKVSEQLTDLNTHLTLVENQLDTGIELVNVKWAVGSLWSSSGHYNDAVSNRVATVDMFTVDVAKTYIIDSGWEVGVAVLDSSDTLQSVIEWKTGTLSLSTNTYYRLTIARRTEISGETAVVSDFIKHVHKTSNIQEQINVLSDNDNSLMLDLSKKLDMGIITDQLSTTFVKGTYLDSSGTERTGNNYVVAEIDLSDVTGLLRITSCIGYGNAQHAFYDSDDHIIDVQTKSGTETIETYNVLIPAEASKIKVSGKTISPRTFPTVCKITLSNDATNSNGGEFSKLLVPTVFTEITYSWIVGAFYYTNDSFVDNAEIHAMVLDVEEGDFYRICGNSYYSVNILGYITDGGTTWMPNASNAKYYDLVIQIPTGVRAIVVQGKATTTTTIKKATGYANGRIFTGKKVAIIGDSTVERNSNAVMKWHDNISVLTGLEVVNLGVSGTGYKRGEENNNAYYQRLSSVPSDCDAVLIFGSGNDNAQTIGTVADSTTDTVCGCVNKTINDLITMYPTVKIGVITAYPWRSFKPSTTNAMQTIANDIVEICRGNSIPVLDLYHCSNLRPWIPENEALLFYNADGCHINDSGHEIITPIILEFLKTILL